MKKSDVFHKYGTRLLQGTQYVIRPGDNLFKIAKNNGVTVEDLISANNLASSLIYPNQIIVIPKQVENGSVYFEEYIVQFNDTIEVIAQKLGVRIDLLTKYNDITKLILAENQIIRIPKTFNTYVILPEDTLETILQKTNMTLEELVNANLANWLAVGETIFVK